MFLEKLGKYLFTKMRPPFFLASLVIPILVSTLVLFQKYRETETLKERFLVALRKEKLSTERKDRKERFLSRYQNKNPYFLNQKIETYPLLQKEKNKLESMIATSAFPNPQSLNDRLRTIDQNRLSFHEENTTVGTNIKEVEESGRKAVQMDEHDLKEILFALEDICQETTDSPQILITDFRLTKQETSQHCQVFEVEIDLLKREFFK